MIELMAENELKNPPEPPPQGREFNEQDVSIWDESDPRAIVNMLPDAVANKIKIAAKLKPQLFKLDEHQLYRQLRKSRFALNATDNRIRLKFWNEYERSMHQGHLKMTMVDVIAGICSRELFYHHYLNSPERVAWMLCPPVNYVVKATEALEFGLEQLRDILELPHIDERGKVDSRLASLKVAIFKMLEDRIKGSVVQKVQSVNLTYSATDKKAITQMAQQMTEEELSAKLRDLESREKRALHLPETVDAVAIPVEPESE